MDKTLKQINEEDPPELDMMEVPKVLGDVFEALFGYIFLDSGHDCGLVCLQAPVPHPGQGGGQPPAQHKEAAAGEVPHSGQRDIQLRHAGGWWNCLCDRGKGKFWQNLTNMSFDKGFEKICCQMLHFFNPFFNQKGMTQVV